MTKKEAVENHRKMWRWIALETWKTKRKVYKERYFEDVRLDLKGKISCDCFCCQYSDEIGLGCKYCPIIWPIGTCSFSIYQTWRSTIPTNYKKCAVLALKISKLSERETKDFDVVEE